MATRKQRTPAINTDSVSARIPDGAWDDFSSVAPEPTHEEMLEVAAEREAEQVVEEDEEKAIEVFMAMAAADTFEAMYKAEEEKGVEDFFDPDFYKQEVRYPAPELPIPPTVNIQPVEPRPRYIPRNNTRRRKG